MAAARPSQPISTSQCQEEDEEAADEETKRTLVEPLMTSVDKGGEERKAPQLRLRYFCLAIVCWLVAGFCPFLVRVFAMRHESVVAISELSGCGLSCICSAIVLSTYVYNYRRHPNRLLVYKTICDLGLSLVVVIAFGYLTIFRCHNSGLGDEAQRQQCLARAYENMCDESRLLSILTQFFAVSSEAWFLILLLDLRRSVKNPFYSFKSSRYGYLFAVWTTALLTALILAVPDSPRLYGLLYPPEKPERLHDDDDPKTKRHLFEVEAEPHVLDFGACWIRDHSGWLPSGFSPTRELPKWCLFYFPLVAVYIFSFHTLYVVRQRLKCGISDTFAARVRVAAVSVLTVVTYATYWAIFGLLASFIYLLNHLAHSKHRSNSERLHLYAIAFDLYAIFSFHKVTKPLWDLLVWLLANDPVPLHQNVLKLFLELRLFFSSCLKPSHAPTTSVAETYSSTDESGVVMNAAEKFDDARLRPQTNDAMQKEVLYYVTSGIRQAARASVTYRATRRSQFEADRPINLKRRHLGHEIKSLTLSRLVSLFFLDDDLKSLLASASTINLDSTQAEDQDTTQHSPPTLSTKKVPLPSQRSMTLDASEPDRLSHGTLTAIDDEDPGFDRNRVASWSSSRGPSGYGEESVVQSGPPSEASCPQPGALHRSSILSSLCGVFSYGGVGTSSLAERAHSQGSLFGQQQPPAAAAALSSRLSLLSQQTQQVSSSGTSADIVFIDYKPQTFRKVREHFGVHLEPYVLSFRSTSKERFTEGGSSEAFFFYSGDERYLVKTCTAQEFATLVAIADDYAAYMCQQRGRTLIVRLLGAHCLKLYETAFYFLVMENVFGGNQQAHLEPLGGNIQAIARFDVKGSWINRAMKPPRPGTRLTCRLCNRKYTLPAESSSATSGSWLSSRGRSRGGRLRRRSEQHGAPHRAIRRTRSSYASGCDDRREENSMHSAATIFRDPYDETFCPATVGGEHEANVTLKDNDLNYAHRLRLAPSEAYDLLRQLRADARLLATLGIMDYSLLLGLQTVEYPARRQNDDDDITGALMCERSSLQSQHSLLTDISQHMQSPKSPFPIVENSATTHFLPHSQACRRQSHVIVRHFYYFGMIDILQRWTLKKRLELWWKVHILRYEREGLSCLPPDEYCNRFQAKLSELLLPNHQQQ